MRALHRPSFHVLTLVVLGALAAVLVAGYLLVRGSEVGSSETLPSPTSSESSTAIARWEAELAQARVRVAASLLERYRREHGDRYLGATSSALQQLADQETLDDHPLQVDVVGVSESAYCLEARVNAATASKSGPMAEIADSPCPR